MSVQGLEIFFTHRGPPLEAAAAGARAIFPDSCAVWVVDTATLKRPGRLATADLEWLVRQRAPLMLDASASWIDLTKAGLSAAAYLPIFASAPRFNLAGLLVETEAAISPDLFEKAAEYAGRIGDVLLSRILGFPDHCRLSRAAFEVWLDRFLADARRIERPLALLAVRGLDDSAPLADLPALIGEVDPGTLLVALPDRSPEEVQTISRALAARTTARIGVVSLTELGADASAERMIHAACSAVGEGPERRLELAPELVGVERALEVDLPGIWGLFEALNDRERMDRLLESTLRHLMAMVKATRGMVWAAADGTTGGAWQKRVVIDTGDVAPSESEESLIARVFDSRRTESVPASASPQCLAIPILHDEEIFGVLFLGREGEALTMNTVGVPYLDSLAARIGRVFKDARAVDADRRREQQVGERLRKEAIELRRLLRARTGMIGNDASIKSVMRSIERCSAANVPVLITGETGTGKEAAARLIHRLSGRRGPLVVVDCGAIPGNLLESELFGHERGAFTGAEATKVGRFQQADGGTIFLDEIGELPLELQPKLLRVLQESTVRPVGGRDEIQLDFRLVAATNRALEVMVGQRLFREDLLFRLRVMEIHLPALRERGEDIALLALYFIRQYCIETGREFLSLSPEAQATLMAHRWPGNVRELQNTIRRAVLMAPGPELLASDLHIPLSRPRRSVSVPSPAPIERPSQTRLDTPGGLEDAVADWFWEVWVPTATGSPKEIIESFILRAALRITDGSVGKASELVGMHPDTFGSHLEKFGKAAASRTVRGSRLGVLLEAELQANLGSQPPAGPSLLDRVSHALLRELLVRCKGNKSEMARAMGWGRQTLLRHLRRLEILKPPSDVNS